MKFPWKKPELLLLAAGAFLRLLLLTKEGFWHDEAYTAVSLKPLPELISFQLSTGQSPLYVMILKPVSMLFGRSELALRLPSVLFGVLAIYALYLLAGKLFENKSIIYTSTALFTFSAIQIHFSQEARAYSMIVFFAILSFYFFVKALEENKRLDWVLYAIASLIAVYLSAAVLHVLAAQFAYSLVKKRGSHELNLALVFIAFLYSPMFFHYLRMKDLFFVQWIPPLSFGTFSNLFFGYLLLPMPIPETCVVSGIYVFAVKLLSFVLLIPFAAGIVSAFKQRGSRVSYSVLLLWMWMIVPIALEIAYSVFSQPLLGQKRYLLAFSPALYMLLAHGTWELVSQDLKKAFCIALVILFSVPLLTFYAIPKREDWRGAIAYAKDRIEADELVFTGIGGVPLFEYYWEDMLERTFLAKKIYAVRFDSAWLILKKRKFNEFFGDGGVLEERFEAAEPADFAGMKLLRLSSKKN